jgi:hypothetical protein
MLTEEFPRLMISTQDDGLTVETSLIFSPDWAERHAGNRHAAIAVNDLGIMFCPTFENGMSGKNRLNRTRPPDQETKTAGRAEIGRKPQVVMGRRSFTIPEERMA